MDYTIQKLNTDTFKLIENLRGHIKEDEDFIERCKRVQDKKDDCYAVFINNECIADVTVTYKSEDKAATVENQRAYLSGLFVKEDYRNKKIATVLIKHLIEQLSVNGYKELSVLVDSENAAACSLYSKLGFEWEKTYKVDEWSFDLLIYRINKFGAIYNSY
ncbi:MAG: GNAT family N-acetyltransferase [Clostridia bacterium]|jgi:ribosomal protein S18 acetylase RimI-like enzyme|nr:GNAT family N-acetyltransferase [Clostridia bacterium]NLV33429.1 GNAT family N-acetyltransferase [Clostridiaceae bacterium]